MEANRLGASSVHRPPRSAFDTGAAGMNTSKYNPSTCRSTSSIKAKKRLLSSPLVNPEGVDAAQAPIRHYHRQRRATRCRALPFSNGKEETAAMKHPARSKRSRRPTKARPGWKRALVWLDGLLATRQINKLSARVNALTRLCDSCRKLGWSVLKLGGVISLISLSLHCGCLWTTSLSKSFPFKGSAIEQLSISKDFARLLWRRLGGS